MKKIAVAAVAAAVALGGGYLAFEHFGSGKRAEMIRAEVAKQVAELQEEGVTIGTWTVEDDSRTVVLRDIRASYAERESFPFDLEIAEARGAVSLTAAATGRLEDVLITDVTIVGQRTPREPITIRELSAPWLRLGAESSVADKMVLRDVTLTAPEGTTLTAVEIELRDLPRGVPAEVAMRELLFTAPDNAEMIIGSLDLEIRGEEMLRFIDMDTRTGPGHSVLMALLGSIASLEIGDVRATENGDPVMVVDRASLRTRLNAAKRLRGIEFDSSGRQAPAIAIHGQPELQEIVETLLGSEEVVSHLAFALSADDDSGTLAIGPVAVSVEDAFALEIAAAISGIDFGLVDEGELPDPDDLRLETISLGFRDHGILEPTLAMAAAANGLTSEQMKEALAAEMPHLFSDRGFPQEYAHRLIAMIEQPGRHLSIKVGTTPQVSAAEIAFMGMMAPHALAEHLTVEIDVED